jgi:hypothetical protein
MKLLLKRDTFTDKSTIGKLYIDGKFECFILEDKDRSLDSETNKEVIAQNKIRNETAIPTGKYKIVINMSPKFKRELPLLLEVPGYTGIRIHTGNKASDTSGCLLPGTTKGVDSISGSKEAFDALFKKLKEAKEEIFISISNR